jgi:excisionase family DNA binding protein
MADNNTSPSATWLSTTQAAVLLGTSRQHVVDLCERGELPFQRVGSHRRILRSDVLARARGPLTREQLKSLWLHRAVAGLLVVDPPAVIGVGRRNLIKLRTIHPTGRTAIWLGKWDELLDQNIETIHNTITSPADFSCELRQNTPFAGVLDATARLTLLQSFAATWQDEHAA